MPFDPCREWLGIDATDLKDPHRVLNIPPTVTDGDEIARLAEVRLAQLAAIAPGPFAKAHTALLTRVAEARDTLLATATWESAPEPASPPVEEPVFSLPPPPLGSTPAVAQTDPFPFTLLGAAEMRVQGSAPPAISPPERSLPTVDEALTELERQDDAPQFVPVPPPATGALDTSSVRQTRASSDGTGLGLFAIFLAVAIAAGYFAYKKFGIPRDGIELAGSPVSDARHIPPSNAFIPPAPVPDGGWQSPDHPSKPSQPEPTSVEPPLTATAPLEPSTSMPVPPVVPPPPEHDPEAERRIATERARVAERVASLLRDAFQALQQEAYDTADRAIDAASKDVGDDVVSATRIERWRLLAAYARAYQGYRDQAFASANSGRIYEVDGKQISVIEVTPESFTYRLSGRNVTVSRKTMSPVLEIGIVETWFNADGRASNYLFLGTRWLCKSPPNLDRARAAWRKAADGGENVAPLTALLDDPITRQSTGP